jgi:hypothetical protein
MKIVFVKTRHAYDSYRDFRSLVELAGFDTCFVEQMDMASESFYIVTPINGEFRPHIDHCRNNCPGPKRAVVAWWNLERPDVSGSEPLSVVIDDVVKYADVVWVGDRYYASMDSRMQHVVLGGDERLCGQPGRYGLAYDYTHQSYVWGRRDATYAPLRGAGLREGPNAWFEVRDAVLKSSRVMVNVHQTEALIGEPIRFAMTAAYRLPMISETLRDPFPMVPGHDYIEVPFEGVGDAVKRSVTMDADDLKRIGDNLFDRFCREWPFRRGVEEGVAATLQKIGVTA